MRERLIKADPSEIRMHWCHATFFAEIKIKSLTDGIRKATHFETSNHSNGRAQVPSIREDVLPPIYAHNRVSWE